ncbi:MAG: prepilin-type N-terminal cleavage/methylation domain-containing protein [Hahellaceae bacterium]|nr:prepilin-type N-terminal cleavage/methylation domain-containing protein [Hahellaceae bacterium]MCP5210537.1 prepilin-type N-terminal cleavage/methylation domain-containing protein [Hahellaceae bacterium]
MKNRTRTALQKGVTLVEMVITIVIISIALIAVINAFSGTAGRSADPLWEFKTLKLAQLYMDEILSKPYDESTPVGGVPSSTAVNCSGLGPDGESRDTYDDVDDYITAGAIAPDIINAAGISMDGTYDDYLITIAVVCAGTELGLANNAFAKRISLTIDPPAWVTNGTTMRFSVYRGNF